MPSAVMRNGAKTVVGEMQHLRFPAVAVQWPAVAEHNRLAAAPVLVVKIVAFASFQISHGVAPLTCTDLAVKARKPSVDTTLAWVLMIRRGLGSCRSNLILVRVCERCAGCAGIFGW